LDPFSAPTAAYDWLVEHPDVVTMDDARKNQLFGLATLYFASLQEGPWFLHNSWMAYDRNECDWFSSADLRHQRGETACNEQGEFIRLDLAGLGFATAENLKLPREIQLLSHLQHLWWPNARIPTVALEEFLPLEFFQLSHLETILLNGNEFTGTIPTDFGRLTKLRVLDLSNNELTGSIPTVLAQLSSLEHLYLWINHLTGTIPNGWDNLKQLFVYRNPRITGFVPEELCLLNQENCFFNPATLHVYRIENGTCDVRFDCSESLCGCDCPCPSNAGEKDSTNTSILPP
jgi:Leucine rich repeat